MHRVQHNLHSLVKARFLAVADRGVLEDQTHAMMPHVCAHVDGELQGERQGGAVGGRQTLEMPVFPDKCRLIADSRYQNHFFLVTSAFKIHY